VQGHIPGALNIPWSRAANDDGTFRPADELHALYSGQGIGPDRGVIAYCRIGERSAHTWFVLHELWATPRWRTTTARGPNTAPESGPPTSADR